MLVLLLGFAFDDISMPAPNQTWLPFDIFSEWSLKKNSSCCWCCCCCCYCLNFGCLDCCCSVVDYGIDWLGNFSHPNRQFCFLTFYRRVIHFDRRYYRCCDSMMSNYRCHCFVGYRNFSLHYPHYYRYCMIHLIGHDSYSEHFSRIWKNIGFSMLTGKIGKFSWKNVENQNWNQFK